MSDKILRKKLKWPHCFSLFLHLLTVYTERNKENRVMFSMFAEKIAKFCNAHAINLCTLIVNDCFMREINTHVRDLT